jgi:hypothetical protein
MLNSAKTVKATLEVRQPMFWRGYCLLELGDMAEGDTQFDAYLFPSFVSLDCLVFVARSYQREAQEGSPFPL